MARFRLTVAGIPGALPCLSILLLVANPCVGVLAGQVDTLELQFQWAYPLSVVDMKLVDVDQDGASEILVGFDSDSARVGVLDAVDQTMVWQSPGLPGSVATVAAGDRNLDGFFDIIAGGTAPGDSVGTGFYQVFDGSDFESISTVVSIDSSVTALAFYTPSGAEWPTVIAGTYWYHEHLFDVPPMEWNHYFSEGHVISFDGIALVPIDSSASGTVRCLEVFDLNRDGQAEVILGEDNCHAFIGHGPDYEEAWISARVIYPESSSVYELSYGYAGEEGGWYLRFDALAVGEAHSDCHPRVIASYREFYSDYSGYPQLTRWPNLRCLDPSTGITTWIQTDSGSTDRISGLDLCDLSGKSVRAVCAAYSSGHLRFKSGENGSDLAISGHLPTINHFALGNVDQDNVTEVCIASAGSLYVFEAPFICTDIEETADPTRPEAFSLHQNYPNPFNPQTTIRFTVVRRGDIRLTIYNILGERVRDFRKYCGPGTHTILWDGKDSSGESVASGVYLYRLTAGDYEQARKMVLLR